MQPRLLTTLALVTLAALMGTGCATPETEVGEPPPDEDLGIVQQASVSCDTWTDTGYVSGDPFTITLVTVDTKPVEIDTANAYVVMQQAAAAAGVQIRVVSGFRTYAQQDYFYDCYQCCCCNSCNLAAKPGYSNHQSGHALDLNTSSGAGVLSWLNAHGAHYGFERTVSSEPWHWEWWGGGPGGGPCGGGSTDDGASGTSCTVTATGETGQCMDTGACADLGGSHESTPGYCPGPSNIQCCTGKTSCTVDETGLSGECLWTSECAALGGDHVSTPGYCPGPSDYQCCTSASGSPGPSQGSADPSDGGSGGEDGATALGGAASTDGAGQGGSGAAGAAVAPDGDGETDDGVAAAQPGCRIGVGPGTRPSSGGLFAMLVLLGSAGLRRHRQTSLWHGRLT